MSKSLVLVEVGNNTGGKESKCQQLAPKSFLGGLYDRVAQARVWVSNQLMRIGMY